MGVTAAASALIYLHKGQIDPSIAMPVTVGVIIGATLGAKILIRTKTDKLKIVFAVVVTLLALQMIYKGISGNG